MMDPTVSGTSSSLIDRVKADEVGAWDRLVSLYEEARARYAKDPARATAMATDPLGPAPQGVDVAELAAWTVVSNVLLNLDEMFMKR